MRFTRRGKNGLPFDVRKVALTALATALEEGRDVAKEEKKQGFVTTTRAVAAGAVLVTAGRAAYKGGRFVRDRLRRDDDEPEAREDEDFDDEESEGEGEPNDSFDDEEPEAEAEPDEEFEDEEPAAEEDEEAEAESDEDLDAEGPDDDARPSSVEEGRPPIFDRSSGRRRRVRPSLNPPQRPGEDARSRLQPPPRPSRSRAPVGRT
jgi:hypothetical protein